VRKKRSVRNNLESFGLEWNLLSNTNSEITVHCGYHWRVLHKFR